MYKRGKKYKIQAVKKQCKNWEGRTKIIKMLILMMTMKINDNDDDDDEWCNEL